jgi:hypothetical protein
MPINYSMEGSSQIHSKFNVNEDIYNKFYSTLLVEIKKVIKRFQWRKACRKYRTNNKERFNKISNQSSKKIL